jgi:hypothetical protein
MATEHLGKSAMNGGFSIAIFDYRRIPKFKKYHQPTCLIPRKFAKNL